MQNRTATRNSKAPERTSQLVNSLRLRVLQAKSGFMAFGTDAYMPFIDAQATREGVVLTKDDKLDIRQVMNGRVSLEDVRHVELIERALESLKAA